MSNYNDGKWHNWDMNGCHPVSDFRVSYIMIVDGKLIFDTGDANFLIWGNVVAFKVIRDRARLPNLWYVLGGGFFDNLDAANNHVSKFGGCIVEVKAYTE